MPLYSFHASFTCSYARTAHGRSPYKCTAFTNYNLGESHYFVIPVLPRDNVHAVQMRQRYPQYCIPTDWTEHHRTGQYDDKFKAILARIEGPTE